MAHRKKNKEGGMMCSKWYTQKNKLMFLEFFLEWRRNKFVLRLCTDKVLEKRCDQKDVLETNR